MVPGRKRSRAPRAGGWYALAEFRHLRDDLRADRLADRRSQAVGVARADNQLNSDLRVGDLRDGRRRHSVALALAQSLVDGLGELGARLVDALGQPAARELLDVLTR